MDENLKVAVISDIIRSAVSKSQSVKTTGTLEDIKLGISDSNFTQIGAHLLWFSYKTVFDIRDDNFYRDVTHTCVFSLPHHHHFPLPLSFFSLAFLLFIRLFRFFFALSLYFAFFCFFRSFAFFRSLLFRFSPSNFQFSRKKVRIVALNRFSYPARERNTKRN